MKNNKNQPKGVELRLGTLLGRRQAFGLVAARCSAADAASLRDIRNEKTYRSMAKGWVEFCKDQLGMSHTHANRIIAHLEEFGPAYFEMAQFTGISAEAYRAIAPAIRDHALHHEGQVIALLPENTEKLARAVEELRQTAAAKAPLKPEALPADRIAALERRFAQLAADIAELLRTDSAGETRMRLASLLLAARDKLKRLSLGLGPLA